ncbi:MAG: glycoside hydrolase family 3 C-terminal domain-containing protein [Spirochaetales bacterium]|nr:glycoside hydrolase family 3 C-terminal domain-containing protein [Spirochaetales bacterium]
MKTADRSWMNTGLTVDERVGKLLSQMTLTEKVGQMNQINNLGLDHGDVIREGRVGSALYASSATAGNVRDAGVDLDNLNAIQKMAVEQSRLGIPLLFARDVIHGHRTVFPVPIAQASSWCPELVEKAASIAAKEAAANGIRWTFTPMLDICRDPRWGRITEGFGEDPCLCSRLAASAVRGYQGDDLSDPLKIAACAKHFAGYGGAEGGRDYNTTDIGYRSFRDIFLPPFMAAANEGIASIMAAFNEIDGVPALANKHMLTEILRNEWKFDGVLISDWNAVCELIDHGIVQDKREAAFISLMSGLDMDMVSGTFIAELPSLVDEGKLSIEPVDAAVKRILSLKFKLGLFERPFVDKTLGKKVVLTPENRACALALAQKSMVLLKNDGILPLKKDIKRILLTGEFARSRTELFGTWTLDGRSEETGSVEEALSQRLPDGVHMDVHINYPDEIVRMARSTDVVIACIGEHPGRSGEANSIVSLDLPPGQLERLKAIADMGIPIVAVVFAGRPLAINWLSKRAAAVLYAWHPGIEGGRAIAEILFGDVEPGGRLPVTFPRATGQIPIYYNHKPTGRPLPPSLKEYGRYNDCLDQPLYPFGFGLSYTSFTYEKLEIVKNRIGTDDSIEVSCTVTNNGEREGEEVVQFYVRDCVASVTRPVKELKAFRRICLAPGEKRIINFTVPVAELSFTNINMKKTVEPGDFLFWIGPNSMEGLEGSFRVTVDGD